ncbi:hypothetical protein [Thorsellia kenyensis]|uniref:Uncharacterized protein n=1 Tax=Thorsellia kenyensis TaxID=1549888 RepID=A0ABV6C7E7_9GAMM
MEQVIENAAESHQKAFRFSNCSKECIKSQLEGYYLDKCEDSRIKPIDKNGLPMTDESIGNRE